jgi:hypothetical protein
LLDAARGQVLLYLDWVMNDMIQVDDAWTVRREIERATDRLLEIAEALPGAMEAHAERCLTSIDSAKQAKVMRWPGERQGGEAARPQFIADGDW